MESSPINQLYGSDSLEAAEREIQHFFPPQHTVALIKPHVSPEQRGKDKNVKAKSTFFFQVCELFQAMEKLKEESNECLHCQEVTLQVGAVGVI